MRIAIAFDVHWWHDAALYMIVQKLLNKEVYVARKKEVLN